MAAIKVVLGKVSMDGHDRGVRVLARLLRDAGMEVVYLGKFLPHEAVIEAAIQENAQVVGLSFLSGEHVPHTRRFAGGLARLGLGRGDRMAVLLPNGLPIVEAYMGAAKLGAVSVPLNPMFTPRSHRVTTLGLTRSPPGARLPPVPSAAARQCLAGLRGDAWPP